MQMKLLITVLIFVSCNNNESKSPPIKIDTLKATSSRNSEVHTIEPDPRKPISKAYYNKRFRDVSVEMMGSNQFRIRGEGQIFEANFSWIIEDGHEELYKGFQMTDAGAPEWGKFEFTLEAKKKRENSTLTLILFESSAMDGSRQHELPILLN